MFLLQIPGPVWGKLSHTSRAVWSQGIIDFSSKELFSFGLTELASWALQLHLPSPPGATFPAEVGNSHNVPLQAFFSSRTPWQSALSYHIFSDYIDVDLGACPLFVGSLLSAWARPPRAGSFLASWQMHTQAQITERVSSSPGANCLSSEHSFFRLACTRTGTRGGW